MNQEEYVLKAEMIEYAGREVHRAWLREDGEESILPKARLHEVVLAGPYTMVRVKGVGSGGRIGVGFAKRTPTDAESHTIGISAATFRAMRDYLGFGEYGSMMMSVS